ncbi:hypothetical protein ACH3WN_22395 [Streptomyces albogriseolus]
MVDTEPTTQRVELATVRDRPALDGRHRPGVPFDAARRAVPPDSTC